MNPIYRGSILLGVVGLVACSNSQNPPILNYRQQGIASTATDRTTDRTRGARDVRPLSYQEGMQKCLDDKGYSRWEANQEPEDCHDFFARYLSSSYAGFDSSDRDNLSDRLYQGRLRSQSEPFDLLRDRQRRGGYTLGDGSRFDPLSEARRRSQRALCFHQRGVDGREIPCQSQRIRWKVWVPCREAMSTVGDVRDGIRSGRMTRQQAMYRIEEARQQLSDLPDDEEMYGDEYGYGRSQDGRRYRASYARANAVAALGELKETITSLPGEIFSAGVGALSEGLSSGARGLAEGVGAYSSRIRFPQLRKLDHLFSVVPDRIGLMSYDGRESLCDGIDETSVRDLDRRCMCVEYHEIHRECWEE